MAGKEIKFEAVGQMKIITKQLEAFTLRRAEDQALLTELVQRLTALEQRFPALSPPPDSMAAAAAHDATSAPQALLPSDLVLPLTSNTCGVPFSSGGTATAGGPPLAGQIAHPHHPLTFLSSTVYFPSQHNPVLTAANHHQPPTPFYHLQPSPYSPQPPPNINLGHLAPSPYSPNPAPILPPTYQLELYH